MLTTGHGGRWEISNEGETEMTSTVATDTNEIHELTLDELD